MLSSLKRETSVEDNDVVLSSADTMVEAIMLRPGQLRGTPVSGVT